MIRLLPILLGFPLLVLRLFVVSRPKRASKRRFIRIFDQVQQNQLSPDEAGTIQLPWRRRHLTKEGKIYVTGQESLLLVLFPLWIGKGSNLRGILMCSHAFTEADTQLQWLFERQERAVTIFAPGMWCRYDEGGSYLLPPTERKAEVVINKETWLHAYYVSNDLC